MLVLCQFDTSTIDTKVQIEKNYPVDKNMIHPLLLQFSAAFLQLLLFVDVKE